MDLGYRIEQGELPFNAGCIAPLRLERGGHDFGIS
jgi:hypothetical protein